MYTVQFGGYVSGGAGWGWSASGGVAIGYDPITGSWSGGVYGGVGSGAYAGVGGSVGAQLGCSGNSNVGSLDGYALDVGSSFNASLVGVPVSVGGTVSIPATASSSPTYWGSIGVGPGTPAGSVNVGATEVYQSGASVYGPPVPAEYKP